MELISITLARLVAFLEVQAIDPFGKTSTLDALSNIGSRYSFAKIPQSHTELDFQKGVELEVGKAGNINIDRIAIYANGVLIDTRSSTEDCEKILDDLLGFAGEAFGAKIEPSRRNFISQIVFRSDLRLTLLNPVLAPMAERLSAFVSGELKQSVEYEPTGVLIGPDLSQIKLAPVQFTIERRTEIPFFANTYFSNAPLRTAGHLELIKQLEDALETRSTPRGR
ncbi:MAG: hypothetical protein ABI165_16805 [Bryobacteraceae bacterium]